MNGSERIRFGKQIIYAGGCQSFAFFDMCAFLTSIYNIAGVLDTNEVWIQWRARGLSERVYYAFRNGSRWHDITFRLPLACTSYVCSAQLPDALLHSGGWIRCRYRMVNSLSLCLSHRTYHRSASVWSLWPWICPFSCERKASHACDVSRDYRLHCWDWKKKIIIKKLQSQICVSICVSLTYVFSLTHNRERSSWFSSSVSETGGIDGVEMLFCNGNRQCIMESSIFSCWRSNSI